MGAQAFTIYDLLARGAALYRDAPALIQGTRQWSFRQLLERADRLASGLAGLGLSKGDRICILAQNDAAYVDLYGACARQGIIAYPINWRLTAQEVEREVERATPRMVVIDTATADRKSTRLNSSHTVISYAVFCLKKKNPNVSAAEHA